MGNGKNKSMKKNVSNKANSKTTNKTFDNVQAMQPTPQTADTITADSVQQMGQRIALKLLKTIYGTSGDDMIRKLYNGLVADINRPNNSVEPFSDGYDIAQTASLFLCGYMGKNLQDNANNGLTDKDGKPLTILRACFRECRKYIYAQAQREYKHAYVDELDPNGETLIYEVPYEWDTPTATDYKTVRDTIQALNLTDKQRKILSLRLRGKSISEIARRLTVTRHAIQKHLQAIQKKYTEYQASKK